MCESVLGKGKYVGAHCTTTIFCAKRCSYHAKLIYKNLRQLQHPISEEIRCLHLNGTKVCNILPKRRYMFCEKHMSNYNKEFNSVADTRCTHVFTHNGKPNGSGTCTELKCEGTDFCAAHSINEEWDSEYPEERKKLFMRVWNKYENMKQQVENMKQRRDDTTSERHDTTSERHDETSAESSEDDKSEKSSKKRVHEKITNDNTMS